MARRWARADAPVTPEPATRVARRAISHRPPLLPIEHWPDRVYGYHPLASGQKVICIQKTVRGYFEVAPHINPYQRNRELGISRETAEAVIRAAWAPGGHVWAS